jgi:hypothetical protein
MSRVSRACLLCNGSKPRTPIERWHSGQSQENVSYLLISLSRKKYSDLFFGAMTGEDSKRHNVQVDRQSKAALHASEKPAVSHCRRVSGSAIAVVI